MRERGQVEGTQHISMPAAAAPRTALSEPSQLLFVIPAFNEQDNLPTLFEDLLQTTRLLGEGSRIFIVDDGSSDETPDLVRAYAGPLPVELVRLPENQGPGAAFREGFNSALACANPDALIVTMEADTTGDLGALPQMLDEVERGADVVLADWRMVGVSAHRRLLSAAAGWVVRQGLGLEATTVSSFFRVYRASTLREASARYGDRLIRERGFACKAELLGKLAAMSARIVEVPVSLDWTKRNGDSKMPVFKTMLCYWRMLFRQRGDAPELPAATEGALGA
jgi:dolichol-phosphate mannosyltransferase